MIEQGDIIVTLFPYSNHKQAKKRPVLVVSNNKINTSQDIIAVGISRNNHPSLAVELDEKEISKGKLTKKSYIHCHKIHLIEKNDNQYIIGTVKPDIIKKTLKKISLYLQPGKRKENNTH